MIVPILERKGDVHDPGKYTAASHIYSAPY